LSRIVFLRTLKIDFALKCRTNLASFCQKKGVGFNLSIILPTTSQRSSVQSKIVNPNMHLAIKREWICFNVLSLPETRLRREGTSLAGEDDLDAPDLEAVPGNEGRSAERVGWAASNGHAHANAASGSSRRPRFRPLRHDHRRHKSGNPAKPPVAIGLAPRKQHLIWKSRAAAPSPIPAVERKDSPPRSAALSHPTSGAGDPCQQLQGG
jgi:hypothetical protein